MTNSLKILILITIYLVTNIHTLGTYRLANSLFNKIRRFDDSDCFDNARKNLEQCVWRTPSEETPENSGICQNNHIVDSCFDIFKSNYSTCLPESRKMLLDSTINVASKYLKYLCGNNATNYKKYQSEEVQNCSMIVRDKLDQYENDYKDYSDEFGDSFKFLDSWEETLEMYKNLEFIMSDFVRSRYCEAMAECEDKSDLEFIDEFFRIMREEFPIEGRTNPVHICPFDELNVK